MHEKKGNTDAIRGMARVDQTNGPFGFASWPPTAASKAGEIFSNEGYGYTSEVRAALPVALQVHSPPVDLITPAAASGGSYGGRRSAPCPRHSAVHTYA